MKQNYGNAVQPIKGCFILTCTRHYKLNGELSNIDAPTNSLKYSNANPKVKTMKKKFGVCSLTRMTHSQFLEGFKCESKQKTMEEGGVNARSLAYNILRGRGVCWSSRMGLRRIDKLHSLTHACRKPTQGGQCIVGRPQVLGRATGNIDT